MVNFLKNIFKLIGQTPPHSREELLGKYPTHLELIDSGEIPSDPEGGPDSSYLTETADFYYELICDLAEQLKDKPQGFSKADRNKTVIIYNRSVYAQWGLIAKGQEAISYATKLLSNSNRDLKEAGAGVFSGLRDCEDANEIVEEIIKALENETDQLVTDSLIEALGQFRLKSAIPILATYIRDENEDGDTRWGAAINLGRIVKKRFEKNDQNAVTMAIQWLEDNNV